MEFGILRPDYELAEFSCGKEIGVIGYDIQFSNRYGKILLAI